MARAPRRIQRKRTRGWRMPPNTVYVGRPTKWGNPVHRDFASLEAVMTMYRAHVRKQIRQKKLDISELRGKNLACWCKLGEACHADILLELANAPTDG